VADWRAEAGPLIEGEADSSAEPAVIGLKKQRKRTEPQSGLERSVSSRER